MISSNSFFQYMRRRFLQDALVASIIALVGALLFVFGPHLRHTTLAYFFPQSPSQDDSSILFYDSSSTSNMASERVTMNTSPDNGGCGCPSCCRIPN
jgi:hypothetical protein